MCCRCPIIFTEIKCQDEHVTIKKTSVKKKTCKPHVVINRLMERMANDVKLLDQVILYKVDNKIPTKTWNYSYYAYHDL